MDSLCKCGGSCNQVLKGSGVFGTQSFPNRCSPVSVTSKMKGMRVLLTYHQQTLFMGRAETVCFWEDFTSVQNMAVHAFHPAWCTNRSCFFFFRSGYYFLEVTSAKQECVKMLIKCLKRNELDFMQLIWLNMLKKRKCFVQGQLCMLKKGVVWEEVRKKFWMQRTRRMWLAGQDWNVGISEFQVH